MCGEPVLFCRLLGYFGQPVVGYISTPLSVYAGGLKPLDQFLPKVGKADRAVWYQQFYEMAIHERFVFAATTPIFAEWVVCLMRSDKHISLRNQLDPMFCGNRSYLGGQSRLLRGLQWLQVRDRHRLACDPTHLQLYRGPDIPSWVEYAWQFCFAPLPSTSWTKISPGSTS